MFTIVVMLSSLVVHTAGQTAGLLSDLDMDQLETWVDTRPKTFTLLYSITKDGCTASTFHQKCDHQGPTVTVLHNEEGSVFGGYTHASWGNGGQYDRNGNVNYFSTDDTAFLFQLRFSGGRQTRKFPVSVPTQAIFSSPNHGPVFGNMALHTFSNTITPRAGVFTLDGRIRDGYGYVNNGVSLNNVNNGHMRVTELEAYAAKDGQRKRITPQQWRKIPQWGSKLKNDIVKEISSIKPPSEMKISEFNILLLGPVGSGKSSFCNTVSSVFRGRISQKALVGGSPTHSTTNMYTPYTFREQKGSSLHVQIYDTPGFLESGTSDLLEYNHILDGHVPDFYEFNSASLVTNETPGFIQTPTLGDKIHCVGFVLDASTLDNMSAKSVDKLKTYSDLVNKKHIPQAVVLTKIDTVCAGVEESVKNVFNSTTIRDKVEQVSRMFDLPRRNILPVKNYENEVDLDEHINILALLATRQLMYLAEDYLDHVHMKQRRVSIPHSSHTKPTEDSSKKKQTPDVCDSDSC